jgi:hypothetical protein
MILIFPDQIIGLVRLAVSIRILFLEGGVSSRSACSFCRISAVRGLSIV